MSGPAVDVGVLSRVVAAAGQGAVGAVVGAILSALSEPIVNRVLVKRIPLQQAMEEVSFEVIAKFFQTTLPTNFVKFPFFEAVNVIMSMVDVSPALRGTVTGAVFTTATLPITNYRYRKSMGLPIELSSLYQAYLPTVLRDIMYGIVRNNVTTMMISRNPQFAQTNTGRFFNMFITVFSACVLSAPGNEYRGYCLQPKGKEKPFVEFFQPQNFLRSTVIGSTIMSTALGAGALVTPQVTALVDKMKAYLDANPLSYCIIALFLAHRVLEKYEKDKQVSSKAGK
ncbi:unnamed protein product [Amoebophrya sp. A25]|nr:unnamed protein product [Amoebophrya sp. A25]|eukprot:GSA25T00017468001.1